MDEGQTDSWLVLVWTDDGQTKDRQMDGQTDGWTNRGPLRCLSSFLSPGLKGGSQVKLGAYRHDGSLHQFKQFNPLKTHSAPLGQTIIPTTAHTW